MKIQIIHLSDIHIEKANEPIHKKLPHLINAIANVDPEVKGCLLIFTGDISFSGKKEQFDIAEEFFFELLCEVESRFKDIPVKTIFVPGNHDCDISNENIVRDTIIEKIKDKKTFKKELVDIVIEPQTNFFNFIEQVEDQNIKNKIYWTREFEFEQEKIIINCFNTAWISTKKEQQGTLLFPVEITLKSPPNSLIISVFHHPYSWLESNNSRVFKGMVEESSDLILTGHEHVPGSFSKEFTHSSRNEFFEGGVLNDSKNSLNSSFNVVLIDFKNRKQKKLFYEFENKICGYKEIREKSTEWLEFKRNPVLVKNTFQFGKNISEFIEDLGTTYSHPRKSHVSLDDIFVFPDLRCLEGGDLSGDSNPVKYISSEEVPDYILSNNLLVVGERFSGKTALTKQAFSIFRKNGLVPIYFDGSRFNEHLLKDGKFEKYIEECFVEQYDNTDWGKYRQLEKEKKVAIIDNVHLFEVNDAGKVKIVEKLRQYFTKFFLVADDSLNFEKLKYSKKEENPFKDFINLEIMPFKNYLRCEMVEKWLILGQEYSCNGQEFIREVDRIDRLLSSVLASRMFPAVPVFILTLLQQIEANKKHILISGSYGELFEFLISAKLRESNIGKVDLVTLNTYLSELAYILFENESTAIGKEEFEEFHNSHNKKFALNLNFGKVVEHLCFATILSEINNLFCFKYQFSFYYFLAKYLADHFHEDEIKNIFNKIALGLHREDYANIIILLSHFSKDPLILETVLEQTNGTFKQYPPCDFSEDFKFLDGLDDKIDVELINLEDTSPREVRQELNKAKDEIEQRSSSEVSSDSDSSDFNRATKALQVSGQILRSYAGSLESAKKIDLANACYALGMRAIKSFSVLLESSLDDFIESFYEEIKKENSKADEKRIKKLIRGLIYFLSQIAIISFIKKVSSSVGSPNLRLTFAEILKSDGNIGNRFVDISIKYDHFQSFPTSEVKGLIKELKNEPFNNRILQILTSMHFLLFEEDYQLRQQVCGWLGIPFKKTSTLTAKKEKVR